MWRLYVISGYLWIEDLMSIITQEVQRNSSGLNLINMLNMLFICTYETIKLLDK